jgi:hypothetical protein
VENYGKIGRIAMQPRGQLWFALHRVCQDFRDFSGLGEKESLGTLVTVLRNLLAEQEEELARLAASGAAPTNTPEARRQGPAAGP